MALFRNAVFHTSVARLENLPPDQGGEVAFSGRSNAGKSSAINTLAEHNRLAFVSKTPGRTQLLNYFSLGNGRFLVDLPGYGYAKVPDAVRAPWKKLIGDYLLTRASLRGLVLVMDSRHPMRELDQVLLEWFLPTGKPVHVLLTKADKLSRSDSIRTERAVRKQLQALAPNYTASLFSSLKKTGMVEAEAVLGPWLAESPDEAPESAGKHEPRIKKPRDEPGA